jgi:TRAP-type C4-dicarboxylate transport system permease small subunit
VKACFPALVRLGDGIAYACSVVAGGALFVIIAINGLNVVSRYFFGDAWSWAEEAMLFLMILLVFTGSAVAAWRGGHMRLDMAVGRFTPRVQKTAIIFTALATIMLLIVLSTASFQVISLLYRFGQKSIALELPMWIPQSFVLGGFCLIAFLILLRLATIGPVMPKSEVQELAETMR